MSFFQKIKLWLGIGGITIDMTPVPGNITLAIGETFSAQIPITSKSDLTITQIRGHLKQIIVEEKQKNGETKKYTTKITLGQMEDNKETKIAAGETRIVDLNFVIDQGPEENAAEEGGLMGGLGKLANFANKRKAHFEVSLFVDAKEIGLDPLKSKRVTFTLKA